MNQVLEPKKSLSQNFLVDTIKKMQVVTKMKNLVDMYQNYKILEVGPGAGDLTEEILKWEIPTTLLEIDPRAIEVLKAKFINIKPNKADKLLKPSCLVIIQDDIMRITEEILNNPQNNDYTKLFKNKVLLSNLPYHIGSRLLIDLATISPQTPLAVILQKEVCQKTSKNNKISFFGAYLNLFYDFKKVVDLSPNCFKPQPKVWSALITGQPKIPPNNLISIESRLKAKVYLKALFASPNKTIYNNLRQYGFKEKRIIDLLTKSNLTQKDRLTWENYPGLLDNICNQIQK